MRQTLCMKLLGVSLSGLCECRQVVGAEEKSCNACEDSATAIVCDGEGPVTTRDCARDRCENGQCVPNTRQVTSLSTSVYFACAVTENGRVWCWGLDYCGETSGQTSVVSGTCPPKVAGIGEPLGPGRVQGLPGPAKSVATGLFHTCAVLESAEVYCWGWNITGQLGAAAGEGTHPVKVPGLPRISAVTAGYAHTCALSEEGSVWCWGANYVGQCGDPGTGETRATDCPPVNLVNIKSGSLPPTRVSGLLEHERVKKLISKKHTTCALTENFGLYCWGANRGRAHVVTAPDDCEETEPDDLFATENDAPYGGQLGQSPESLCFSAIPLPMLREGANTWSDFSLGFASIYGLGPPGESATTLFAWGLNQYGQLGTGRDPTSVPYDPTPQPVIDESERPLAVTELFSSEGSDQCAALSREVNGSFFACWGKNDVGELGTCAPEAVSSVAKPLSNIPSSAYRPVLGETVFARAADYGCFVDPIASGNLKCWGNVPAPGFDYQAPPPYCGCFNVVPKSLTWP